MMPRSGPLVLYRNVRSDAYYDACLIGVQAPMHEHELLPWHHLRCESKAAVGFEDMTGATDLANALQLEMHIAYAPALSYMKIRGERLGRITVIAVDNDLVLLDSSTPLLPPAPSRGIYIIYNMRQNTMTMIPSPPPSQPLLKHCRRRRDRIASASSILISRPDLNAVITLATISSTFNSLLLNSVESQDILYVCRFRSSSPSQWDEIHTRFPTDFKGVNVANSYATVVGFCCKDIIFWVNLLRGVIYCPFDALRLNTGSSRVFGFIKLPVDPPSPTLHAIDMDSRMYRTMACVTDSHIMFVNINGFIELRDLVDCVVEVWTIFPENCYMKVWSKLPVLSLRTLAEQDEFKKAGLPTDMVPMYPRLNKDEEDVLYLMLGEYVPCCFKHRNTKHKCVGYVATAGKALYHLRIDMKDGLLLGSTRFSDQLGPDSPDVILANQEGGPQPHQWAQRSSA